MTTKHFNRRFLSTVLLIVATPLWGDDSPEREWSTSDGRFKIQAIFVEKKEDKAVLKRSDNGRTVEISLWRLCDEDRKYVAERDTPNAEKTPDEADKPEPMKDAADVKKPKEPKKATPPSKSKRMSILGIVQDEQGRPIAGVPVRIDNTNQGPLVCLTDDAGRYSFKGLAPQSYGLAMNTFIKSASYASTKGGFNARYIVAGCKFDVLPGSKSLQVVSKDHDGLTRLRNGVLVTTMVFPRKVTVDTIYQPDGSTDFNKNNVRRNRYILELPECGNRADTNQKVGEWLLFDPATEKTLRDSADIQLIVKERTPAFGFGKENKQGGFYDLGTVNFDSVKSADPAKIRSNAFPCVVNHVYVVRTGKGYYAKLIVRSIDITMPIMQHYGAQK